MTPLGRLIAERIAADGPMRLDRYMALCLGHPEHGYYVTRDPFGAAGDFITAPEVSQMFGELVGAWAAQVWADLGAPDRFVLAELGPGRGTLLRDALRAAVGMPGFVAAARIALVETSPVLRARQAETLAAHAPLWVDSAAALPDGPAIVIANEFFDALPIRQFQRLDALWRERLVGLDGARLAMEWGAPCPDAALDRRFPLVPDGAVVEVSPAGEAVAAMLGARIVRDRGAALVFDYGPEDGIGDTLQALRSHAPADPLAAPGEADLTAHVGFAALAAAARPARAWGPVPQGVFLERLGITARARALARAGGAVAEAVAAAHRRLTHPEEMGNLLRVLAFAPEDAPAPPGFIA
jgi:NADH dehydrogenase [ubiquinone] 1 alpha subcomplex assembly factor 7